MQEGICAHVRTLVTIFTPSQSFLPTYMEVYTSLKEASPETHV